MSRTKSYVAVKIIKIYYLAFVHGSMLLNTYVFESSFQAEFLICHWAEKINSIGIDKGLTTFLP